VGGKAEQREREEALAEGLVDKRARDPAQHLTRENAVLWSPFSSQQGAFV
jgi:hypothetical protein